MQYIIKKVKRALPCGSVAWASSRKPKGHWFNSRSRHMPGLCQVPSWGHVRNSGLMFLSHISVSLPLFLPPFPSLYT